MSDHVLRCRVSAGMFSTEACVTWRDSRGKDYSDFIAIEHVSPRPLTKDEVFGLLNVKVHEVKDGTALVTIPSPQPHTMGVMAEDICTRTLYVQA